ncbi:MAG: xanthine dehydrogenase family protein subunit M, partial [bacterium]|nr:xanthine dehydrogenase family protein subunit M [bacterium]
VDSAPVDVLEAAELLKGKVPTDERINELAEKAVENAHPVANAAGATPAYRRKMAGILTRRALRGLIK